MEGVKEWLSDTIETNPHLTEISKNVSSTTDVVFQSARSSVAAMQELTSEVKADAQGYLGCALQTYAEYEGKTFAKLKEGVHYCMERPGATTATAAGLLFCILPGTRRAVTRNVLGLFQSEEAMLNSADRRVKALKQSVELMKNETRKLEERARLAEEELIRGQTKLRQTGNQIRSLLGSAEKTEGQGKSLIDNLRQMPGREPVRLRAELAATLAEAKQYKKSLHQKMYAIDGLGV